MMGAIGIFIAIIVNIFVQSSALHMTISVLGVLIFAGLTAFYTQEVKQMYLESDGHDVTPRKSIFGAFILYGAFVTMFIFLLQLFGSRD